ncbi:hypothetical protein, partial [Butyricicoccus sp.]|uniref:hypothetical protein n=1 Tax=Butyricicoccus sp. TaxID=2049021 RepID=UPI003F14682E
MTIINKKILMGFVSAGIIVGVMFGICCTQKNQTEEAERSVSNHSKGKIGIFIAQNGNEFTSTIGNSAKQRGEQLGYDVSLFDGKSDQN